MPPHLSVACPIFRTHTRPAPSAPPSRSPPASAGGNYISSLLLFIYCQSGARTPTLDTIVNTTRRDFSSAPPPLHSIKFLSSTGRITNFHANEVQGHLINICWRQINFHVPNRQWLLLLVTQKRKENKSH